MKILDERSNENIVIYVAYKTPYAWYKAARSSFL